MKKYIQKTLFRILSLENYLQLLQRSFFVMYKLGALKKNKEYEYHYFAKKLIKRGDVIVDIGANLGYYSILFSSWTGRSGKVYSVEPIELYNKVFNKKAKERKNIILYPYALGKEEKDIKLVSSPRVGYLRTGLPHVYDSDRDGDINAQEFTFDAQMKIPSRLFASLDRLDYIKCDIEGFEHVVLSDMESIINTHKPIVQVEVWKENEEPILNMFQRLCYKPYKLNDGILSSQENHLSLLGDYIFIHEDNSIKTKLKDMGLLK
ncbi:FkbM family methyltransferase [Dysgonomonas sp. 511]|uniref:FkbM family methyltransferase n=1 Tax=Dysgonomonas sp. 511 TaxID=2302930 RepID=UPI0013D5C263|nr:FkbM family methyltransferase [Dysgonomonas sp. 511]NDV77890.1 FkbM family methyltransferase [Dysgonomonas sp. 511]